MPPDLLARFDIVGFDPPGVDRTAPIICLDGAGLDRYFHADPEPPTPAGFAALVAADRTLAAGCEARSGAELPYVSTVDAARDMDVLRAGPGRRQAHLSGLLVRKPAGRHLRRAVSDPRPGHGPRRRTRSGPAGPHRDRSAVRRPRRPAAAVLRRVRPALACAWRPGRQPRAAFEALVARVRANPLPAQRTSRPVGPAAVLWGTAPPSTRPATWPELAQALQAASHGDGTDFLALFDEYTGRAAPTAATAISSRPTPRSTAWTPRPLRSPPIQADAPAAEAAAPVFGLLDLYGEVGCSVWPVPATGTGRPDARQRVAADRGGRQHRRPGHPVHLGPVPGRRAGPGRAADPGRRRAHRLREQRVHPHPGRPVPHYAGRRRPPGTRCPSD